ncbi:NAD(P)/FAD-dependent oxidoreductase [Flavivirga spongiicola]|uniref:FAD-binding oxidoreductase n=1 Tax=Flavivirga spongiicola TaxID=421621 RepID=A0ABU7XNW2_9FLAO|nr:FAD-binding oxidoreductase [Flavivirga sp. MEBiC05379]MDO5977457.1 FAD-binding oxidoreductase [Flavivirga sp. MEBiC05379]
MKKVVIIGGGTIGTSVAYYVSKLGDADVTLVDKDYIGSGNTASAASLITLARSKKSIIPLVKETIAAIGDMEQLLGEPSGVMKVGSIHIAASETSEKSIRSLMDIADEFGLKQEWLTSESIKEKLPWINIESVRGGAFMKDDCYMESTVLANNFAKAAKMQGAKIKQYTNVEEILSDNGKITGIKTKEGVIPCDVVVDAAGAWSNLLSMQASEAIPMAPVRSIYWITGNRPDLFNPNQPMVIFPDASAYCRPEGESLLFGIRDRAGVHVNPKELPDSMHGYNLINENEYWDILLEEGQAFQKFFPDFENMEIAHCISGISTYTPDASLAMGSAKNMEGLYIATGCSGAGVATSGGYGRVIAELIYNKQPYTNIDPFKIDRFGDFDPFEYDFRQRCADARSNKKEG